MHRPIICALILLLGLTACQDPEPTYLNALQEQGFELDASLKPFYHGVASGDPGAESVVIWTRVTPDYHRKVKVDWEVATDSNMETVVASGRFETDSLRDYTVKVLPEGLEPGRRYYYRFEALGGSSPIGRTATLPRGSVDSIQLAFASCSNYQFGYFNAYDRIADNEDIFAVLHLGDYIYEYEAGRYGDSTTQRFHIPEREIQSLQDYRERYAQYRTDEGLRRAHQMHPFITIWDDHELSNNAYRTGAENHQPEEEGAWEVRKRAAIQAYFEWLPIRDEYQPPLYRSFELGDLADLMMLEGRLQRSPQVESTQDSAYASAERTMLGEEQLSWLSGELKESDARWRILGNQVVFSDLNISHIHKGREKFTDMWSGYPHEQRELMYFLGRNDINNVLVFTGDFHSSLSAEVTPEPLNPEIYDPAAEKYGVATEFVVQSVNSANYSEYFSDDTCRVIERKYLDPAHNPHVKYANMRDHGYVLLHLTPEEARVEYHYVEEVARKAPGEKPTVTLRVPAGRPVIRTKGEWKKRLSNR